MSLLLAALLVVAGQKAIQFSWTAGNSPGWTLVGYTLYDGATTIATFPQSTTSYDLPFPSVGTHTYTLAQNAKSGSGAAVQSRGNPGATVTCQRIPGGRKCFVKKVWQ